MHRQKLDIHAGAWYNVYMVEADSLPLNKGSLNGASHD